MRQRAHSSDIWAQADAQLVLHSVPRPKHPVGHSRLVSAYSGSKEELGRKTSTDGGS